MSLAPPRRRPGEYIPPAYGGCSCSCHRMAGVMHCVPCCYPDSRLKSVIEEVEEANKTWESMRHKTYTPNTEILYGPSTVHTEIVVGGESPEPREPFRQMRDSILEESQVKPDIGKPRC